MPKPSRAEIATLTELLSAAGLTVRDPGEIDRGRRDSSALSGLSAIHRRPHARCRVGVVFTSVPSSNERRNGMASKDPRETPAATAVGAPLTAESLTDELSAELLIEEVSIDGMCGVY